MVNPIKTSKFVVIALTITAIVLTSTTVAVLTVNQNVSSSGTVSTSPNIGVYSDSGCTQNKTAINWGTIALELVQHKQYMLKILGLQQ